MSFITNYNQILSLKLKPFGFHKAKGSSLYCRLINHEILHYITFMKTQSLARNRYAFYIMTGAASIYSYELSDHQLTHIHGVSLSEFDERADRFEANDDNLSDVLTDAAELFLMYALPVLDNITDQRSYVNFLSMYRFDLLKGADQMFQDSILLWLTNNHDCFRDVFQHKQSDLLKHFDKDDTNPSYLDSLHRLKNAIFIDIVEKRDLVYNNLQLQQDTLEEAEKRRIRNLQQLRSFKVI